MYLLNIVVLRKFKVKEDKDYLHNLRKNIKFHRVKTRILFLLLKQSKQITSMDSSALWKTF
jgi:hypothetical protein